MLPRFCLLSLALISAACGSSDDDGPAAADAASIDTLDGSTVDAAPVGPDAMPNGADAAVPATVIAKLLASDGAMNDSFGQDVAISGDTAIVGANFNSGQSGSAYVFVRNGNLWTEQAILRANDAADQDLFGSSVAIVGDTVIVGSPGDDTGGASAGSAYVFVRTGTQWEQQEKLAASDPRILNRFGFAVALSGETALVGANANDNNGAAYIFERTGTTWSDASKLVHTGSTTSRFGRAVALDGDTAVIGAELNDSVFVFVRGATSWNQQAVLPSDSDTTGTSVAVEGDTLLVGLPRENNDNGFRAGATYVYTRSGTTWTEQAQLLGDADSGGELFGNSVALEGERALVGCMTNDDLATNSGAGFLFERSGTTWSTSTKLTAPDTVENANLGFSVGFDADLMLLGTVLDSEAPDGTGSAYVIPLGALPL